MFAAAFAWAKLFPLRDWLFGLGLVAVVIGYLFWADHERNIGEQECQAGQIASNVKSQAIADKQAPIANAKTQADLANIVAPLPDYLRKYGEPVVKSDCKDVPYVRKVKAAPK